MLGTVGHCRSNNDEILLSAKFSCSKATTVPADPVPSVVDFAESLEQG